MKKVSSILPLLISVSLVACSSAPKNEAKYRTLSKDYKTWNSGDIRFPPVKTVTLENGLKVYFVYDESLPRLSFSMITKIGSQQENASQAGINALTAYTLTEGTQTRSALALNEAVGQLGSEIDVNPGQEITSISMDVLSINRVEALDLFMDVVQNPAFSEGDFARIKKNVEAKIKKTVDNPGALASQEINEWYFGDHPFARSGDGTLETVGKLKRQDAMRHYLAWYRPNNSVLAVVGKYDEAFESQVAQAFGSWTSRPVADKEAKEFPAPPKERLKKVVKKGLKQSEIRYIMPGVPRKSSDTIALRLANEVLGGGFSSRLNQKIRGELGLTYSIYSYLQQGKNLGTIRIGTFTKNETVGKLIEESDKVLNEFWSKGISQKELDGAKKLLIGQFPTVLETSDRIAFNIMILEYYGLDPAVLTTYTKDVEKMSLDEVNAAIKKYFDPSKMRVLTLTP